MSALSISSAWEETKALLARDGRLFASVALALIVLPAAVMGVVDPRMQQGDVTPGWLVVMIIVVSIISLGGQLALIRLAVGPSVTVGGAIGHGLRRLPVYLVTIILLSFGSALLIVPLAIIGMVLGVGFAPGAEAAMSGPIILLVVLFVIALLVIMTRFLVAMPVASVENAGPITILKRSWELTRGQWLKLFGFLVVFSIGALVTLAAVGAVLGSLTALLFDARGPLTLGALVESLLATIVAGALSVIFTLMLARVYAQLSGRNTVEKAPA